MRPPLVLIALFVGSVVGCGEDSSPAPSAGTGGSVGGSSGSTSGGTSGAGATSGGSAGTASGAAGTSGGTSGASGSGAAGAGGASTGGASGMGGSGATAGSGGSTGAGAGGATSAGSGGASGGSGGSGGSGTPTGCTRELLESTIDAYFVALAAHDPSSLPLADGARLTENGEELAIGQGGLWTTVGTLRYAHSALDTMECTSATQAVVPDGSMDIPLALRLKLENAEITEIETIAVRPGDYSLASNTQALIASNDSVDWEAPVPAAEQNTRAEITYWMDKYFRMFPQGVCDVASGCTRIENGGGSFSCSAGGSCASGDPGPGDNALSPRLILADVESGLGVGFTMFMGNTDMHIFKMRGGEIHGVSAVLGQAGSSGWE